MKVLITGGAGFVGINLAHRLLTLGHKVTIYDNFSRANVEKNISWLKKEGKNSYLKRLTIIKGDVRDFNKLKEEVLKANCIFHLAAQVAVTSSITSPREDLEVNILGTFNVLEAARLKKVKPIVIYASTNKVYGELKGIKTKKEISEERCVDFHSPYGVSKGSSDQYVRDYYRIYNLPTVVFRQSCVYGPHQYGVEDQGWIAHFAISFLKKHPITIYGDGKQIRDLLYIDDLIDAYLLAVKNINKVKGEIFNIGGGINNSLSLKQSIKLLEKKLKTKIKIKYAKARAGDQKIFISDNSKLYKMLGFKIKTGYSVGIDKLLTWLQQEKI